MIKARYVAVNSIQRNYGEDAQICVITNFTDWDYSAIFSAHTRRASTKIRNSIQVVHLDWHIKPAVANKVCLIYFSDKLLSILSIYFFMCMRICLLFLPLILVIRWVKTTTTIPATGTIITKKISKRIRRNDFVKTENYEWIDKQKQVYSCRLASHEYLRCYLVINVEEHAYSASQPFLKINSQCDARKKLLYCLSFMLKYIISTHSIQHKIHLDSTKH